VSNSNDLPRRVHPERYRSYESPGPVSTLELDRLYAEGWQLVAAFPYVKLIEGNPTEAYIYYFERRDSGLVVI
jgi:hypothetical protein